MPVLLYCIVEDGIAVQVPKTGVRDKLLENIEGAGLACIVSRHDSENLIGDQPIRDMAVTFSRVLQEIFGQAAIIPFRFPTLLTDVAEVQDLLKERGAEYRKDFSRLRDAVQMELRLTSNSSADAPHTKGSGTQYLRARQAQREMFERVARQIREATCSLVRDWRQSDLPSGLRVYALVQRALLDRFVAAMREVHISTGFHARLSGPWPATEFLEEVRNVG
ncbi:MAG TPA: GvpL/GvpF family gas vesicle protein [Terriglobales bacterium]|nr:GvpL/GvpF family gas vesicle protein [Terriglobales bacterium]